MMAHWRPGNRRVDAVGGPARAPTFRLPRELLQPEFLSLNETPRSRFTGVRYPISGVRETACKVRVTQRLNPWREPFSTDLGRSGNGVVQSHRIISVSSEHEATEFLTLDWIKIQNGIGRVLRIQVELLQYICAWLNSALLIDT